MAEPSINPLEFVINDEEICQAVDAMSEGPFVPPAPSPSSSSSLPSITPQDDPLNTAFLEESDASPLDLSAQPTILLDSTFHVPAAATTTTSTMDAFSSPPPIIDLTVPTPEPIAVPAPMTIDLCSPEIEINPSSSPLALHLPPP